MSENLIGTELEKEMHSGKGVKADGGKPDYSLLELKLLEGMVKVLTFGAKKYSRDNWKKVPEGKDRYFAALQRHLAAWQSGEKIDPESGENHLDHALCNLYFLRYFDK